MPKEYIDRKALLLDLSETLIFSGKADTTTAELRGANKVISRIQNATAADVAPVVHGEWIAHYEMMSNKYETVPIATEFECSKCGMRARSEYEYCHCGAKMDGGKNV